MLKVHNVTGAKGGEVFLIEYKSHYFLYDTGFSFSADNTVKNIRKIIENKLLKFIFISHSHYDHVMGIPKLKKAFPEAKIVAHEQVAALFKKEKVRKAMWDLDCLAAKNNKMPVSEDDSSELSVDITVRDGDKIKLNDLTFTAIYTPGHTRDSVSYAFDDVVMTSESLGLTYDPLLVTPEFVTSYKDSIESIDKIEKLNPDYFVMPHVGLIEGNAVSTFYESSKKASQDLRDFIIKLHEEGYSVDDIVLKCKEKIFHGQYKKTQPDNAFILNRKPMVEKLLDEVYGKP